MKNLKKIILITMLTLMLTLLLKLFFLNFSFNSLLLLNQLDLLLILYMKPIRLLS